LWSRGSLPSWDIRFLPYKATIVSACSPSSSFIFLFTHAFSEVVTNLISAHHWLVWLTGRHCSTEARACQLGQRADFRRRRDIICLKEKNAVQAL